MTYATSNPLYVMAKPASDRCNLHCAYCYYMEASAGRNMACSTMSDRVLEAYVQQYLGMYAPGEEVVFCWHGGEPLLRDRTFYERALSLQQHYAEGRRVVNVLQTNGTLLTDDWCRFLRDHNFLVGVSLDGPEDCHDHYRTYRDGRPSFAQVMHGVERMQRHGVEYNIMAVINDYTAEHPLRIYRFLSSLSPFLQFSPNVERMPDGRLTPSSVSAAAFGTFYCTLFDHWYQGDIGRVYVQLFDATLACLMGQPAGVCLFGENCGHAAMLEADGQLYCCDHFSTEPYRLGNILEMPIPRLMLSPEMHRFGQKKAALPDECKQCSFLSLCHGECPKNRLDGLHNHLCEGYRMYFRHTLPRFQHMAEEISKAMSNGAI